MQKFRIIIALTLLIAFCSCKKENSNADIEISNLTVSYNSANDYYDPELKIHFTKYTCKCIVTNNTGSPIDKVVVNYEFDNGVKKATVYRSGLFDVFDDNLFFYIPIRFESASEFSISFRLITENNMQSNMLTDIQTKPQHAF